ncbi:MAG: hypothetical protein ABH872_04230 [Candidatus Omnitrophota bacterium]
MSPNPILKVLFTLKKYKVKSLLIGGQACIIYGAAEFSRDSDFVILCSSDNLNRLKKALNELSADPIYVPELKVFYLKRGHACHFRCGAKEVEGLRIYVMAKLKGCDDFKKLWERRNTVLIEEAGNIDIISLYDLVLSKKTQRDKDWLMLKRLVENDILLNKDNPNDKQVAWWLKECRNPDILIELAQEYPEIAKNCSAKRTLIQFAFRKDAEKLISKLHDEEVIERQKDKEYWAPLKKELELLRHDAE